MSINNKITITQSDTLFSQNHKVELVTTNEAFEALRDSWRLLNNNSSKGNLFTSWEWLHTWWEIYQNDGNRTLYILQYMDETGNLIGLAPFQIVKNPKRYFPCSRQLIMIGTGEIGEHSIFGEYMDLLIIPGYESTVINAFSKFLYKQKYLWDGMKFHQVLADSHISHLFDEYSSNKHKIAKTVKAYGFRTLIELPETYKDYLMGLKKKMRNNITRTFLRLQNEQEYTIETIKDVQDCDQAISILSELNLTRRGNLKKPSVFESKDFVNFHRKIAKCILRESTLCQDVDEHYNYTISLRILRFKEEPVAALYSFIDGDTIHVYQSGFETVYGHRYSLLTTMLTQEISKSIENKSLRYFNFMFSDEESTYKRRYSGTTDTMYDLSYDNDGFKYTLFRFIHGPIKESIKNLLKVKKKITHKKNKYGI